MKAYTDRHGRVWSPAERMASLKKTKEAIAKGIIPPATKCNRCGQTRGIIQYHNHDYSSPTEFLEALCWRCHMMFHSVRFAREQVDRYFSAVESGKQWPPVYKHDFGTLARDHGVVHPTSPGMKSDGPPAQPYDRPPEGEPAKFAGQRRLFNDGI